MLLDISRALRSPGETFPFTHEEQLPQQDVMGDQVRFDPVELQGSMTLSNGRLRLMGELSTQAHSPCIRCLEPARHPIHVAFDELFSPPGEQAHQEDPLEDDERMVFDGPMLDLSHLVLTLTLLELPLRLLCSEDCKGLLTVTPLDHMHAGQKELPDEHPFSALQELLNKDLEV